MASKHKSQSKPKPKYNLGRKQRAKLNPAERFDVELTERIAPAIRSPLGRAFGAFGKLGDEPPLLALSAGVTVAGLVRGDPRLARTGVRMIAAHLVAIAAKSFGKAHITRSRPKELLAGNTYRMEPGGSPDHDYQSFPSGHTAGAFAVARAAAREYPHGTALLGGATAMGLAQVFRQAHFAGDVLAGAIVGVAAEAVSNALLSPWLGAGRVYRAGA